MRGDAHVRFGKRDEGNGAGETRPPRPLPTSHVQQDPDEMEVLFTLLAEMYERRSLLITSSLVFSARARIFQNPMAIAAAIDRLVHHSTILEFDVPSYRTAHHDGEARDADAGR